VEVTDSKLNYSVIFFIQELQFAMGRDGGMSSNDHFLG
jgi:hypothetical protein